MKSLVTNFCLMTNKVSGIIIAKGMFNWKAQYWNNLFSGRKNSQHISPGSRNLSYYMFIHNSLPRLAVMQFTHDLKGQKIIDSLVFDWVNYFQDAFQLFSGEKIRDIQYINADVGKWKRNINKCRINVTRSTNWIQLGTFYLLNYVKISWLYILIQGIIHFW